AIARRLEPRFALRGSTNATDRGNIAANQAHVGLNIAAARTKCERSESRQGFRHSTMIETLARFATDELQRLLQQRRDPFVKPAAEPEFRPIPQDDGILAGKRRAEFLHAIEVYDGRAMNPHKSLRIESLLQPRHRLTHEVRTTGDVEFHVVPLGLDPID